MFLLVWKVEKVLVATQKPLPSELAVVENWFPWKSVNGNGTHKNVRLSEHPARLI